MNGKFRFNLETLLKYRKSIESQRQIELANLINEQNNLNDRLNDIRDAQINAQNNLRNHTKAQKYMMYMDELSKQSFFQKNAIKEIQIEVNEKREQLMKASIDKKIIEKLKDKKFSQHKQNMIKNENKILDEIAANRFQKKGPIV